MRFRGLRRSVAIFAPILLVLAPAASASVRLVTPAGNPAQPYQRWAEAAEVPTPNLRIVVVHRPCPGSPNAHACVFRRLDPPKVYVNPRRPKPPAQRPILILHEIGHYFDFLYLGRRWHERFARALHRDEPWRGDHHLPPGVEPGPRTWGPPSEVFAEAYAECARKGPEIRHRPRHAIVYRYRPGPAEQRRVCRMIGEAAPGRSVVAARRG